MRTGYVYIMANRSRRIYVGVTSELKNRVWEHKNKVRGGFTARYEMTKLVYFQPLEDMLTALKREKQLKGWRRSKKVNLIESVNPNWTDLTDQLSDQ